MIGWRPFLLTLLAAAALAVLTLDVTAVYTAPHHVAGSGIGHWLHTAFSAVRTFVSDLGLIDWILAGAAAVALIWGWVPLRAAGTLGQLVVNHLQSDGAAFSPAAAKAALQQALGGRGLLPPSGVPSGFPSVTSVADAISKAPVAQASWLGSLIGLIPFPQTSTQFTISGTLVSLTEPAGVRFAYQLVCTGATRTNQLDAADGADQLAAIENAGMQIYRQIAQAAPTLYPKWARWRSEAALDAYRGGLEQERLIAPQKVTDERAAGDDFQFVPDAETVYRRALDAYTEASRQDPDNMLARLRAANCLERIAGATDRRRDPSAWVEANVAALAAYVSIRAREPDIIEAEFRASILMSVLAGQPEERLAADPTLEAVLSHLERAQVKPLSGPDPPEGGGVPAPASPQDGAPSLGPRLERGATREARLARHRLLPFWTVVRDRRPRHLFEPRGHERRQLRKALALSGLAQRARRQRARRSNRAQIALRLWIYWRYTAGRARHFGWQAHYNAACFYALLPQAGPGADRSDALRLRRRALRHLTWACQQAGGNLQATYVRDEDPDLQVLRDTEWEAFLVAIGPITHDELVIRYQRPKTDGKWVLHVWGPATIPAAGQWDRPLGPVRFDDEQATFHVRIFDENQPLHFLAHCGEDKDDPGWVVLPVRETTATVIVHPDDPAIYEVAGEGVS